MALEALKKALNGNLKDNKSIPFWSWNNALDEKELVKQIEDMHAAVLVALLCTLEQD